MPVIFPNSTKTLFTNSSGYFSLYGKPTEIIVSHNGQQKSIKLIDSYVNHFGRPRYITSYLPSYANISKFYNSFIPGIYQVFAVIIGYNGTTAKVITLIPNTILFSITEVLFTKWKRIIGQGYYYSTNEDLHNSFIIVCSSSLLVSAL